MVADQSAKRVGRPACLSDGAKEDETTASYDITDVVRDLSISDEPFSGSAELTGQLGDVRIIEGEGIYAKNFTRPAVPPWDS